MELREAYVAEFSAGQKAYHIDTLTRSVQVNARALVRGGALDYAPFYVGSEQDCRNAIAQMQAAREGASDE